MKYNVVLGAWVGGGGISSLGCDVSYARKSRLGHQTCHITRNSRLQEVGNLVKTTCRVRESPLSLRGTVLRSAVLSIPASHRVRLLPPTALDATRVGIMYISLQRPCGEGRAYANLTAGALHDLALEYRERRGAASVALLWESASTARDVVPREARSHAERRARRVCSTVTREWWSGEIRTRHVLSAGALPRRGARRGGRRRARVRRRGRVEPRRAHGRLGRDRWREIGCAWRRAVRGRVEPAARLRG